MAAARRAAPRQPGGWPRGRRRAMRTAGAWADTRCGPVAPLGKVVRPCHTHRRVGAGAPLPRVVNIRWGALRRGGAWRERDTQTLTLGGRRPRSVQAGRVARRRRREWWGPCHPAAGDAAQGPPPPPAGLHHTAMGWWAGVALRRRRERRRLGRPHFDGGADRPVLATGGWRCGATVTGGAHDTRPSALSKRRPRRPPTCKTHPQRWTGGAAAAP